MEAGARRFGMKTTAITSGLSKRWSRANGVGSKTSSTTMRRVATSNCSRLSGPRRYLNALVNVRVLERVIAIVDDARVAGMVQGLRQHAIDVPTLRRLFTLGRETSYTTIVVVDALNTRPYCG